MSSSHRIAINTVTTYLQSLLGAALALFSSRWVLKALGETDFGLFNVVGSLIIFITFLNSVTASSVTRHFAYSIGQNSKKGVERWFNTALSLHICLATFLVLIGYPAGKYVIENYLSIPPQRLETSLWVFRMSLASIFFSMACVPFVAMFTAKQVLSEIALWGTVKSILIFFLAFSLIHIQGDRLFFYALGMTLIIILVQLAQLLRAVILFGECKITPKYWFDVPCLKKIFSFTLWSLIGGAGFILRNQGSAIMLNLFFGPRANAAFGIANQVSNQSNHLSTALMRAFAPEITSSEARGDRKRMLFLSLRASKLGTLFVLFFAIPLIMEMDYVLKIWLHKPPEHTALLCRLLLITFLIDRLSAGYMLAVNAYGKIAAYQVTLGSVLVFTLFLSWLFLKAGYSPSSIGFSYIITMTICSIGRAWWAQRLFAAPIAKWFRMVIWPCFLVAFGAISCSWFIQTSLPQSLSRLLLTCGASSIATFGGAWFCLLDVEERNYFKRYASTMIYKIFPKLNN